jgi:hypothetical protein
VDAKLLGAAGKQTKTVVPVIFKRSQQVLEDRFFGVDCLHANIERVCERILKIEFEFP